MFNIFNKKVLPEYNNDKYAIILLFNSCHNYIIDFIKDGVRPRTQTI